MQQPHRLLHVLQLDQNHLQRLTEVAHPVQDEHIAFIQVLGHHLVRRGGQPLLAHFQCFAEFSVMRQRQEIVQLTSVKLGVQRHQIIVKLGVLRPVPFAHQLVQIQKGEKTMSPLILKDAETGKSVSIKINSTLGRSVCKKFGAESKYLEKQIGNNTTMLVEQSNSTRSIGKSEHFTKIQISQKLPVGSIVNCKIQNSNIFVNDGKTNIVSTNSHNVFGPEGNLSSSFEAYENQPSQVKYSEFVDAFDYSDKMIANAISNVRKNSTLKNKDITFRTCDILNIQDYSTKFNLIISSLDKRLIILSVRPHLDNWNRYTTFVPAICNKDGK